MNYCKNNSKDFVIEDGVLKEYQGKSNAVIIPDGVTEIGKECFSKSIIKSVIIPNSVTTLGEKAFWCCINLKSVEIPDSVTSIDDYAFQGCLNLTSLIIPDSVTSIGKFAFSSCFKLYDVTISEDLLKKFKKCFDLALYDRLIKRKQEAKR